MAVEMYEFKMSSRTRSRSDGSFMRWYEVRESDMLSGRGLMRASSVAWCSGGSYFAARDLSSCTAAYDNVRKSCGRLGYVSSARYCTVVS